MYNGGYLYTCRGQVDSGRSRTEKRDAMGLQTQLSKNEKSTVGDIRNSAKMGSKKQLLKEV